MGLLLQLMGSVKLADVTVETMCVINAVIVLFLIAQSRGQREQDQTVPVVHLTGAGPVCGATKRR